MNEIKQATHVTGHCLIPKQDPAAYGTSLGHRCTGLIPAYKSAPASALSPYPSCQD
jgi:hypothetical protein